jgi:hypothetical protein
MTLSRTEQPRQVAPRGAFAPTTSAINGASFRSCASTHPIWVSFVLMEVRAELALWCKLFPKSKA